MSHLIEKVRKNNPLVHNITNQVVMNFTANGLYAIGASPVMAQAQEEVEEMAKLADALVLNIGTLTQNLIETMILAGKAANEAGIPVILDPVGVGATTYRTKAANRILEAVDVTVVRGNAGEIANLTGIDLAVRGVDGTEDISAEELAEKAFDRIQVSLVITGREDVIINKKGISIISNGNSMLTKVTGTGCLLSSVIAAFLAVSDTEGKALEDALCFYGIAAENAARYHPSPGTFQASFLDQLFELQPQEIAEKKQIARR